MMKRRTLISAGGLCLAPLATRAQPARKVWRIGLLGNADTTAFAGREPRNQSPRALLRGLGELGYVYGEHYVTEARGSAGLPERFPSLVAELLRSQVDVIVATGVALPALKLATSTIPIVMAAHSDPVGAGHVQSLARPGGNVTGLSYQSVETIGKRLELLKECVPGQAPVAVLWDRTSLGSVAHWRAAQAAARQRGWKLVSIEIGDTSDIEAAFKTATNARAGALLVSAGGRTFPNRVRVAELAARSRLPTIYELRPYVEAGGLISYGADIVDIWHRAAVFVDKILKGASPADMPVEQPTKFELVINVKTAKALGLVLPTSLLLRADEVIE